MALGVVYFILCMKKIIRWFVVVSPYLFICITFIVGIITPGYNHLAHTVSRLSISENGWMQNLNILQFALSMVLALIMIDHRVEHAHTKKVLGVIYMVSAALLVLLAIFPTDPIDIAPATLSSLSWAALVHFGLVFVFVLTTPIGIHALARAFKHDGIFRSYAKVTMISGYVAFILSLIWFVFFALSILNTYRGLFQRIIILIVLWWFTRITHKVASLQS